jgi:hypothetical protein
LGVVNSPQRRAGAMMNGTWNIANRILLLRVSQTLILQVRLSAFEGFFKLSKAASDILKGVRRFL